MKWMLFYKELDSSKSDPSNRKAFLLYVKDRDLMDTRDLLFQIIPSKSSVIAICLQSYSYFNGMGDPDEGLGWTWNSSKNRFSELY